MGGALDLRQLAHDGPRDALAQAYLVACALMREVGATTCSLAEKMPSPRRAIIVSFRDCCRRSLAGMAGRRSYLEVPSD